MSDTSVQPTTPPRRGRAPGAYGRIWLLVLLAGASTSCSQVEITTVTGPVRSACGGFLWRVQFRTNEKAGPYGGWLVQKVDVRYDVRACDGTPTDTLSSTFYEAWRIEPGDDRPALPQSLGVDFDDQYSSPDHGRSIGEAPPGIVARGIIKFFDGVPLPPTMVPNNPNTLAGMLHSDTVAPPFWDEAGADAHDLEIEWNCCESPPRTSELRTVPRTGGLPPGIGEADPAAEEIAGLLHALPAWTDGYGAAEVSDLAAVAGAISRRPAETIRRGLERFTRASLGRDDSTPRLSRAYLLLRTIFRLPPTVERDAAKTFGGWVHPSVGDEDGPYDILWPVRRDGDRIVSVEPFRGYFGPPYDPVAEFDYLASHFERPLLPQDDVLPILGAVPPWTAGYDAEAMKALLAAARRLSALPLDDVRRGIRLGAAAATGRTESLSRWSAWYVLLRVLFAVPPGIERPRAKTFGGWVHPSVLDRRATFDLLWPVALEDGRLSGVKPYRGYLGPPPDLLGEFDFFREQFGPRRFD